MNENCFSSLTHADLFTCKMCGDCCKGYGGAVVDQKGAEKIADFLGLSPKEFIAGYCTEKNGRFILLQKKDGFCRFYEGKCTIHPVKPEMCRRWPFIRAVAKDPENWYIMGRMCKGMRMDLDKETILAVVCQELKKNGRGL